MLHGRRRNEKCTLMTTLYAREFATVDDHIKGYFSLNTYGTTFVINNSTTAIICSQHRLFTGPLVHISVTLDTAEELTTLTKLFGSMKFILTDNDNKHHSYLIPRCVFDQNTPVYILGIIALVTFFGDNSYRTDPLEEDGTTLKSGATKSHLIWDHVRHERLFMHSYIQIP